MIHINDSCICQLSFGTSLLATNDFSRFYCMEIWKDLNILWFLEHAHLKRRTNLNPRWTWWSRGQASLQVYPYLDKHEGGKVQNTNIGCTALRTTKQSYYHWVRLCKSLWNQNFIQDADSVSAFTVEDWIISWTNGSILCTA